MAEKSKSIIPPDKQIPVMIVGAIILALLLWRQFGPKNETPDLTAAVEFAVTADTTTLDALSDILSALNTDPTPAAERPSHQATLARDPFYWPPSTVETTESMEYAPAIEQRSERANLHLSGILLDAQGSHALINGKCLKKGDMVEGCLVRSIDEKSVVIEDFAGTRTLHLPEVTL